MDTAQRKVLEFHLSMGSPIRAYPSLNPGQDKLRLELLREETRELSDALRAGDIVKIADALGDLKYVIEGTALAYGIDLKPVFNEVHRSNMTKEPKIGMGKARKGRDYKPPKLKPILDAQASIHSCL